MCEGRHVEVPEILEVFTPSGPITRPERFVGRVTELRELMTAFSDSDVVPVITGAPSHGKTSLLVQLKLILEGVHGDLLSRRQLDAFEPSPDQGYMVVYLECDETSKTIDVLCDHIIEHVRHYRPDRGDDRRIRFDTISVGGSIGVVSGNVSLKRVLDGGSGLRGLSGLLELAEQLASTNNMPTLLVLILDEFEMITPEVDSIRMLRRLARGNLRVIVGVQEEFWDEIRARNTSGARRLVAIRLDTMSEGDVDEILEEAVRELYDVRVALYFSAAVREYIQKASGREPWYVQMVGSALLGLPELGVPERKFESGDVVQVDIELLHVRLAELAMVKQRLNHHKGHYLRVIEKAPRRALILRTLARFPLYEIPSEFIGMLTRSGVPSARAQVKTLEKMDVVRRVGSEASGGWRFCSPEFRAYCRLIDKVPTSVDDLVDIYLSDWMLDNGG